MSLTDAPAGPLRFSATFPCDGRFCPAVADLAVRVAGSLGYPEAEARSFGEEIYRAFELAVGQSAGHGSVHVDVTLRAGGEALDASVRCSDRVLLELTRPRAH
jgi:hypothetical protein